MSDARQTIARRSLGEQVARCAVIEGLLALFVAVGRLVLLKGASPEILTLFVVPPLFAFAVLRRADAGVVRVVALSFLLLVALGALIARFPVIFPRLGGMDRALPNESDRLLSWYAAIYLLYILGIGPGCALVCNLRLRRQGAPAELSRLTCYLGLLTVAIVLSLMPMLLGDILGLWPII